jgi:acetylglutamate kinase
MKTSHIPRPTSHERPSVVKIGGALTSEPEALAQLWRGVRRLRETSPVVLVHGGGPQATELAGRLGHTPRKVQGRRITTGLDLDVMQYALRGKLSTDLVASASVAGISAVGISGVDGGTLRVVRRPPWTITHEDGREETVDFGHVGDVERVEPALLRALLGAGFVPIVSPLGVDEAGAVYNVNADTVALAIAEALEARAFYLVTESGGVRREADDPASHLETLTLGEVEVGVAEGWIAGGMRPKLHVATRAVEAGIETVRILAPQHLTTEDAGTQITYA